MKRILSTILALVMILSVFSCITVTASAIEENERYQIETNGFKNGQITFDIKLTPNQTIYDAMVSIKFDTNVLEIVNAGAATTTNSDGDEVEVVTGYYESGVSFYDKNCYTFAYVTTADNGFKIGSTAKSIFTITLKVKNSYSAGTDFNFYAGNNESTLLIDSFKNISTLDTPEITNLSSKDKAVSITWKAVSNATQYKIYKKTSSGFEVIATVGSDVTSYVDTAVENGKSYVYGISAVDSSMCETLYKTASVTYKLAKPANPTVKVTNTKSGVVISWGKVENAQMYNVYKRTYNEAKKQYTTGWVALKKKYTGTSYADTSAKIGEIYVYKVKAINGTVESETNTKKVKYNFAPTVTVANASKGVKVKWSTVANATGYIVYRSELSKGKWSSYKSLGKVKSNVVSYGDTKVKSGVQYKYTVRAVNGSVKSAYNKAGVAIMFLAQPKVKIGNNVKGMKVAWNKIAGAKNYVVYRAEYKKGKWTELGKVATIKGSEISWIDTTVKSGVSYKYTVRAVNGKIKSSYKATGSLMYLATPKTTVKAVSNGITVGWTQSAGATEYSIYRSEYNAKTKKWSGFAKIGTKKSTVQKVTDKKAKKGVKYKYTVKAVKGKVTSAYKASAEVKR